MSETIKSMLWLALPDLFPFALHTFASRRCSRGQFADLLASPRCCPRFTMNPQVDDQDSWGSDSSASSSSSTSSLATTTMLGLPDGPIESSSADLKDFNVSRLGGPPTFLSSLTSSPPISSTLCPSCGLSMELLVQLYAPLEGSVDDRLVYVLGCARAGCQGEKTKGRCVLFASLGKAVDPYQAYASSDIMPLRSVRVFCLSSVRVFTSTRRNDKYAVVQERKQAKKAARQAEAARAKASPAPSANPFAVSILLALPCKLSVPQADLLAWSVQPASGSTPFNPFAAPLDSSPAASNPFASSNPFAASSEPTSSSDPTPSSVDALSEQVSAVTLASNSAQDVEDAEDKFAEIDPGRTNFPCHLCRLSIIPTTAGEPPVLHLQLTLPPLFVHRPPAWSSLPSYPPLYLSTQTEYIPKPRLTKAQKAAQAASLAALDDQGAAENGGKASKKNELEGFDTEGYFKGSGIPGADEVFERFLSRVRAEPEQVVR
jgi:hypothetical protein